MKWCHAGQDKGCLSGEKKREAAESRRELLALMERHALNMLNTVEALKRDEDLEMEGCNQM